MRLFWSSAKDLDLFDPNVRDACVYLSNAIMAWVYQITALMLSYDCGISKLSLQTLKLTEHWLLKLEL